jgi:ADP-ribose pyrophosphatase
MDVSLPDIRLELLEDISPPQPPGFLRLLRRRFRARYADGTTSAPFVYDEVDRPAIDAVVIAAHYRSADGTAWVYLRSALRPPVVHRDRSRSPVAEADPDGSIWELPAGLIEVGEQTPEGVRRSAARELEEELGFRLLPELFEPLGPSTFPCAGVIGERHFFYEAQVDPRTRMDPGLDGSALERGGVVVSVALAEALAMCRDGRILDAKTELGLRRLEERLA